MPTTTPVHRVRDRVRHYPVRGGYVSAIVVAVNPPRVRGGSYTVRLRVTGNRHPAYPRGHVFTTSATWVDAAPPVRRRTR